MNGARDLLLLILVGAIGTCIGIAATREPVVPASSATSDDRWTRSAIGQTVHLPNQDSFGREIELGQRALILIVPCNSCAKDPLTIEDLPLSLFDSVVVAFDGAKEEIPKEFTKATGSLNVLAGGDVQSLPMDWRLRPPQAFVLEGGVIIGIPHEDQTLKQFLAVGAAH